MLKRLRKKIRWTRGTGDAVSTTAVLFFISVLFLLLCGFMQFMATSLQIGKAAETVGRSVAVCKKKDEAITRAQNVAEVIITNNGISNVQTNVTILDTGGSWKAGTKVKVSITGDVKTVIPVVSVKNVTKNCIVTLEGYSSTSTNGSSAENIAAVTARLRELGFTDAGIAGVLGNLIGENGCQSKLEYIVCNDFYPGLSYAEATTQFDQDCEDGTITLERFLSGTKTCPTQWGYGIGSFTSKSIKRRLWEKTIAVGKPINDVEAQIDVIIEVLQSTPGYALVKNASDPREAAKYFYFYYEMGGSMIHPEYCEKYMDIAENLSV